MEFPEHFQERMFRRGVTAHEVDETLTNGWPCSDARGEAECRVQVFPFEADWEGRWFAEKEVTVYFKYHRSELIFVTLKTRYGSGFPRGDR
jgi:hypothetical protein